MNSLKTNLFYQLMHSALEVPSYLLFNIGHHIVDREWWFGKFLVLLLVVVSAVIMDFSTGKVSNYLIIVGLIMGFFLQILSGGKEQIIYSLAGAVVPLVVLMLVFLIGGIGAGDIKLFSVIGLFLGAKGVFTCIVVAFIIGAVMSLGKILVSRNFYFYFNNLVHYVSSTYQSQKIQIYKREKRNTIHFTLPILISVLLYMGGIV